MRISKLKAFTMAEAILVMTILGIIATIMITTLKPAQFKDQGLEIMARKVMSEIDTAVTQILINDSKDGSFNQLLLPGESTVEFLSTDINAVTKVFKKYLTTTRKAVNSSSFCYQQFGTEFFLKDGACIGLIKYNGISNAMYPGESATVVVSNAIGAIIVDTNGYSEPNAPFKDQFVFPIGNEGIIY